VAPHPLQYGTCSGTCWCSPGGGWRAENCSWSQRHPDEKISHGAGDHAAPCVGDDGLIGTGPPRRLKRPDM